MIDLKLFRENTKFFRDAASAKNIDIDVDLILDLDRRVRSLKAELDTMKAQKNEASKDIAKATSNDRQTLIESMRQLDRKSEALEAEYTPLAEELNELLHKIPNPPLPDVPPGKNDTENRELRVVGHKPKFTFVPKDHLTLAEGLKIIDVERARQSSGARFAYFVGDGTRLQLALISYALEVTTKYAYTPVIVPHLITAKAMRAMGYLEHGGHDEIYYLAKDNLYLIGTSEQAIGPMHSEEIMAAENLPLRYVGISPCYRREAGSYGKDTKGVIRMHQFDKVEMFTFCAADKSADEHALHLEIQEELVKGLGLPYHVLDIVSGDLGLPAAKKWDIEVWFPSQERYRETHSTSNCTDFQARRLNTRYKTETGNQFVHTTNGTAFAIGRTMAAILENFQREDGSVTIPEVLRPYMGGQSLLKNS